MAKYIFLHSHPIQYLAPMYAYLNKENIDVEVWYCSRHGLQGELDKEFNTYVKWDVDLLEGYEHQFLNNSGNSKGIYSFFGLVNWELIRKIRKLNKEDVLVLHGWNYFSYILAFFVAILSGKKLGLRTETPVNQEASKKGLKHKLRKIFVKRFFLKRFDYIFYMGGQNKYFYLGNNVPSEKLHFMPYAVDNDRFREAARKANRIELREKYGIPQDALVYLYSGKLIPKKRPMDLLKALRITLRETMYVVFMGDGELRPDMEDYMKLHSMKNVKITGFVNQSKVTDFYALADTFVMCSGAGETWGLSTNEAMNFGIPVLVSEMCGNSKDLVKDDKNGYTFQEAIIKDLSFVMQLIQDAGEKRRLEMGQMSKTMIEKYSYQTVANTLRELT